MASIVEDVFDLRGKTPAKKEEKKMAKKKESSKSGRETIVSLWEQTSQNGLVYYSGVDADGRRVVGFVKQEGYNEKAPDIKVFLSEDNR